MNPQPPGLDELFSLATAEPRTAEPRKPEPRTAEPRTAEPRTAEPRTAEPRTAEVPPATAGRHARLERPRSVSVKPHEVDYRLRGLSTDPTDYIPSAPTRPERQRRRPRRPGPLVARAVLLLVVTVLVVWLIQALVARPFLMPGSAMAPTLQPGDRILVMKPDLLHRTIHKGEVVVVRPPRFIPCDVGAGGGDLVLRVVALPGQSIWSIGRTILVDGRPFREGGGLGQGSRSRGFTPIPSTTLGRGQYYLLGDNRAHACDSRDFGPVPKSSIVGQGIAIVERQGHVFLRKL